MSNKVIKVDDLKALQANAISDPGSMMVIALNALESLTDGTVTVVEGSNPFTYSLETAVTSASVGLDKSENLCRKLFSKMANSTNDLYLHMSDGDYLNRFAKPGSSTIAIVLPLNEVISKSVPTGDGTGSTRLVIPKDSEFSVDGVYFTLQYPVVIKVLYSGVVDVQLDTTNLSPVHTPETNDVNSYTINYDSVSYLAMLLPVQQMRITSQISQLTTTTGFTTSYSFDDYFFYARAYMPDNNGDWKEISVQHNATSYDSSKATVCLTVGNGDLGVYIPQIYFSNGVITDAVRIDIYTTKGAEEFDFTETTPDKVKHNLRDLDNRNLNKWQSPLTNFSIFSAVFRSASTGGAGALTFQELKNRVVSRTVGRIALPVTSNELSATLADAGFDMITSGIRPQDRQYVALREIPAPSNKATVTSLSCSIETLRITTDKLASSNTVVDNNRRVVITPDTLFKRVDGAITLVTDSENKYLSTLGGSAQDGLAALVNESNYLYTPFHYVLDSTENQFRVRPYLLTSPTVIQRYLVDRNDTLGVVIETDSVSVVYSKQLGYRLYVTLKNNSSLKAFSADRVSLQISFTSKKSTKRYWVKGTLAIPVDKSTGQPINDNWQYQFDLSTNFDVNSSHQLRLSDSGMYMDLIHDIDIVVALKNHMPTDAATTDIDSILSVDAIDGYSYVNSYIAATRDRATIKFGEHLNHLWTRSRSIPNTSDYQRYDTDVLARYTKDIYRRDRNGNLVVKYDDATSETKTFKLFNKGDVIKDAQGNPTYIARKGDIKRDPITKEPLLMETGRSILNQVDIFFIDAIYYFANNESTVNYVHESLETLRGWINEDLEHLQKRLLERTTLYYRPKTTNGSIDVIVGDSQTVTMEANRSVVITYSLPNTKRNDQELKKSLKAKAAETLVSATNALISNGTGWLTKNDLETTLSRLAGNDVIGVKVSGYFPDGHDEIILTNVSEVPTLGKKLVAMTNLTLIVEDDIDTRFEILGSQNDSDYLKARNLKR